MLKTYFWINIYSPLFKTAYILSTLGSDWLLLLFFFEKEKTSKYERQSKIKKGKISEKAYKLLDFSALSSKTDIRKKFKEVVKSLHPDTNGGDNSQEDLLKEVISAYKTLKSQGHC